MTGRSRTIVIATIMESTANAANAAIEDAARSGADAAEVRLDAAPGLDPGEIGRDSRIPLFASCRAARDGGSFIGGEEERIRLLERAARTGRFRIDVEHASEGERLLRECPESVGVISHHDLRGTPADLDARARGLLAAAGPGRIAKLVTTANDLGDALSVRDLIARMGEPRLAAFAMGEPGRLSRVLAGAWGSAAVWAAARPEAPGAPGQIGIGPLLSLFRFRSISSATRIFGVAGSPVARSLSPAIHNAAFAHLAVDAVYVPLECRDAAVLVRACRALPLDGVSVTAPLKIAIVPFLAEPDASVLRTGACNTLVAGADLPMRGFNTDGPAALEEILSRVDIAGRPAIVAGAGGAARAVALALADAGAHLTIAARDRESARRLAQACGARSCSIPELGEDPRAVVVQATSAPLEDPVLPERTLRAAFVLDLRYGPTGTGLVRASLSVGTPAADGLGMLVRQAASQTRLFTGRDVPVEVLRNAARQT